MFLWMWRDIYIKKKKGRMKNLGHASLKYDRTSFSFMCRICCQRRLFLGFGDLSFMMELIQLMVRWSTVTDDAGLLVFTLRGLCMLSRVLSFFGTFWWDQVSFAPSARGRHSAFQQEGSKESQASHRPTGFSIRLRRRCFLLLVPHCAYGHLPDVGTSSRTTLFLGRFFTQESSFIQRQRCRCSTAAVQNPGES